MAKNKETGVAVITPDMITLENVPTLLDQVNKKINELKGGREKNVRITETLGQFGSISGIKDLATLRGAYAYVTKKLEAVNSFNWDFEDALGQKVDEAKENGYTVEQWQKEILAQAKEITFATTLEKLEATRKILMENVSKEQKFQESMKDIVGLLSKTA